MKKINQGNFKIFTSKANTINRLMQLQGVCKDIKNTNNCRIEFRCNKHGKIIVESQWDRFNPKKAEIFTKLYGDVIEQANETQIVYYTAFDKNSVFSKLSTFLIASIILLILIVFVADKIKVLIAIIFCIIGLVFQLISIKKEKDNSSLNSDILIKTLENKVNMINNWEK